MAKVIISNARLLGCLETLHLFEYINTHTYTTVCNHYVTGDYAKLFKILRDQGCRFTPELDDSHITECHFSVSISNYRVMHEATEANYKSIW